MPSSSSFSNISAASDIAPGTPQRSPTHAPSPDHQGRQTTTDEHRLATQQTQAQRLQTDSSMRQPDAGGADAILAASPSALRGDQSSEQGIQPALQLPEAVHNKLGDTLNEPLQSMPLLANSTIKVLSDKLADSAQLLDQDMMLQHHQIEESEADNTGLSARAVQTGFRAAGKVSMAEGMSEPVTEAVGALGPIGNSLEEEQKQTDSKTDDKGRIMKVPLQDVCQTPKSVLHSTCLNEVTTLAEAPFMGSVGKSDAEDQKLPAGL